MKNQNGNVLFLILIAVALFAALSYAVTQSSRGGGNADKETLQLKATEILQYGALLKATTDKLRLINGCDLTELSIEADWNADGSIDGSSSDRHNTTSPTDGSCHYFDSNGGGLSLKREISGIDSSRYDKGLRLHGNLAIAGFGSDTMSELIFTFRLNPTAENQALCNAYNRVLGLPEDLADSHNAQMMTYFSWSGSFTDGNNTASTAGDSATALNGQPAGCYDTTIAYDAGGYVFYYVLAER